MSLSERNPTKLSSRSVPPSYQFYPRWTEVALFRVEGANVESANVESATTGWAALAAAFGA